MPVSKKLKGTPDRVWLAGLGALAIAEQEGNDLFQQLVKKGEEIERTIEPKNLSQPGASAESDTERDIEVVLQLQSLMERREAILDVLKTFRERRAILKGRRAVLKLQRERREALRSLGVLSRRKEFLESLLKKREVLKRDFSLTKPAEPSDRKAMEVRQARRLESAKRAFLKEFDSLAKPVDCERLLQERKIFAIFHQNAFYVPSFQFDERGRPRPAIERVIQILGKDTSDWGIALWFTAANGWLDDKRPVDLLKDEPEKVIQAAEQEAAELVF